MDAYAASTLDGDAAFTQHYPSQEKWNLLAEFEGILLVVPQCGMSLQGNHPVSTCAALLEIYLTKHQIDKMMVKGPWCISLKKSDYNQGDLWDASTTIEKLDKYRKRIAFDILKCKSQVLICRLYKEYWTYFLAGPDVEAEKALCAHPMLVAYIPKFFVLIQVYKMEDISYIQKAFVKDMCNNFCFWYSCIGVALLAQVGGRGANEDWDNAEENVADETRASGMHDMFLAFKQAKQKTNAAMAMLASGVTGAAANDGEEEAIYNRVEQECEKCYLDFRSFCHLEFNIGNAWQVMIEKYPTKAYKEEKSKWNNADWVQFVQDCHNQNFCRVGQYFDVMAMWNEFGTKFWHVFPSAVVWLSRPASNAFQERVFSFTSWFDSNCLMWRQSHQTFKLRALECMTRGMHTEIEEEERKLQAAIKDKKRKMFLIPPDQHKDKPSVDRNIQAVQDKEQLLHISATFADYSKKRDKTSTGPATTVRYVQDNIVDVEDDKVAELMEEADDIVLVDMDSLVNETSLVATTMADGEDTATEVEERMEGQTEGQTEEQTEGQMTDGNNCVVMDAEGEGKWDTTNKSTEMSDQVVVVEQRKELPQDDYNQDDDNLDNFFMIDMLCNNKISLLDPKKPIKSRLTMHEIREAIVQQQNEESTMTQGRAMTPQKAPKDASEVRSKEKQHKKSTTKQAKTEGEEENNESEEDEDYYSLQSDSSSKSKFNDLEDEEINQKKLGEPKSKKSASPMKSQAGQKCKKPTSSKKAKSPTKKSSKAGSQDATSCSNDVTTNNNL